MRYHFGNPYFYFECSGLVWYATSNPAGEFSRIDFRNGNIYH